MDRRPSPMYRLAIIGLAIPTALLWSAAILELLPFGEAPLWWSVEQFAQLDRFQPVVLWARTPADETPVLGASPLRPGDTVLAVNGRPLRPGDWGRLFRSAAEGGSVSLTVLRDQHAREIRYQFRFSLLQMVLAALVVIGPAAAFVPVLLVHPGWFQASPAGLWRALFASSIAASLIAVNSGLYAGWQGFPRTLFWLWLAAMAAAGPISWWRVVISWLGPISLHRFTAHLITSTAIGLGVLGALLTLAEGFAAGTIAASPDSLSAFAAAFGELIRTRVKDVIWVVFLIVGLTARPGSAQPLPDASPQPVTQAP